MAGFFSRVVCRTVSRVTASLGCTKDASKVATKIPDTSHVPVSRTPCSGEHRLPACSSRQLAANSLRHFACSYCRAFGQRPNATGRRPVLPRKRNRRFIAGLVLRVAVPHRRLAPLCGFQPSLFGRLTRNRALLQSWRRRVPDGRGPRCANKLRSSGLCGFALHLTRLAGCRAAFPTPRRNCPWPFRELHLLSAHFLFPPGERGQLVRDRKMHCALPRQRPAEPLPAPAQLLRAGPALPASALWWQTRRRYSTSRLSPPDTHY